MAELSFTPVFQEVTCTFSNEPFSTMYFGRHCGKNILILKHDLSLMIAFGDNIQWSNPELIKSVFTRGNCVKGIQVVGNENVILMLDDSGNLWRLINAFDFSDERCESLHSLDNTCFYEWVPFKKFNFAKVLALCSLKQGFACIGFSGNLEKKLAVLPSVDLPVEEFKFDGLNATDSFNYYLISLDINTEKSVLKYKLDPAEEVLLVTDRLKGRTYLCTRHGKNYLINQSNIYLISALHYPQNKCVTLCFESGKLVFYFYNGPERHCIVHLPKKLVTVEKCCCCDFCMLWLDGINLHHTKLTIECGNPLVKASHLELFCAVQSPISLLRIHQSVLAITINNIYYVISACSKVGVQITKHSKELLNDINKFSRNIEQLELNIDMFSYYLFCKDLIEAAVRKEKIDIMWEENCLVIKSHLSVSLRQEFWKLRLKAPVNDKELVHIVDFKFDMSDGMCIKINNPFKKKCRIKVSLIGHFDGMDLFLDIGEVGEPESGLKKNQLGKYLENILTKRNPEYAKSKNLGEKD